MIEDEDHDGWMDFNGTPAVGRRPPVTIVYAPPGVRLTAEQQSAVSHEFRIFSRWVKTSSIPNGWHTHHVEFADGTKAEFRSMLGEFTTEVWPTGGADPALLYRGFVIKPKFENDLPTEWTAGTALLRHKSTGEWAKWVSPYKPGRLSVPTYFVDTIRSRPRTGIQEEQPWFDVYLWEDKALYLNGARAGSMVGNLSGLFVVLRQLDTVTLLQRVYFTASSSDLYRVEPGSSATLLYNYDPFFAGSTEIFTPGPRKYPETDRIDLLMLGKTIAGALQVRRAELTLLRESPWFAATATESQLDVPGIFVPTGGYTAESLYVPSEPFFPIRDANALVCGWRYPRSFPDGPTTVPFSSYIRGSSVGTDDERTRREYIKTLNDSAGLSLYDDVTCSMERECSINSRRDTGDITWHPRWPGPRTWTSTAFPGGPEEAGLYGLFQGVGASLGGTGIDPGDFITTASLELGGQLVHLDTSVSTTTINTEAVDLIYSAETTHTIDHTEGESYDHISITPPATTAGTYKFYYVDLDGDGDFDDIVVAPWDMYNPCTKVPQAAVNRSERVEVLSVTGSSKDVLFADDENGTYVWLYCTLDGTTTTTTINGDESTDGSVQVACRLVLRTPTGEFTSEAQNFTGPGVKANLLDPPDITFGSSEFVWKFVSPKQGMPIYSPLWSDQGPCPHIAYTTEKEHLEGVTPQMLASFRIQISLTSRPLDVELPTILGATQFKAPMLEQLVTNHSLTSTYALIGAIENEPFVLNASYPGANVHDDIGIDGTNPKSEFYRS